MDSFGLQFHQPRFQVIRGPSSHNRQFFRSELAHGPFLGRQDCQSSSKSQNGIAWEKSSHLFNLGQHSRSNAMGCQYIECQPQTAIERLVHDDYEILLSDNLIATHIPVGQSPLPRLFKLKNNHRCIKLLGRSSTHCLRHPAIPLP